MSKKLFDFAIGNPPYMESMENTSDSPVYHSFMDATFGVADKVELITPARFLFDAGKTPKKWNEERLNDEHFKVLHYESDAKEIFQNTSITGGVAITYRNSERTYGAIRTFSVFPELNSIFHKVTEKEGFESIFDSMISSFAYHFTPKLHKEHPEVEVIMSKGHANDVTTNVFEKLPKLFFEKKPNDGKEYIKMYGRFGTARTSRYIRRDYICKVGNIDFYKLFLSKADGAAGTIGNPVPARIIGKAFIGEPGSGGTASFFSIGCYKTMLEAENAKKYVESKFARTMLSILKITQDATPMKWKYVPAQDFTEKSDINWNTSIKNIDKQLYKKYGLSDEEINFIETNVKEME